jgi:anti-sigma regulatory factor (Ser/Thr protein kinase)
LIRLGVALHEALTNAMYHGNLELDSALRQDGTEAYFRLAEQRRHVHPYRSRKVEVAVQESPLEGRYVICDAGAGFDPMAVWCDPTDPANLERPSGRGLFLIRTFMHEVRHNARGNEITLVHRRRSAHGPAAPASSRPAPSAP